VPDEGAATETSAEVASDEVAAGALSGRASTGGCCCPSPVPVSPMFIPPSNVERGRPFCFKHTMDSYQYNHMLRTRRRDGAWRTTRNGAEGLCACQRNKSQAVVLVHASNDNRPQRGVETRFVVIENLLGSTFGSRTYLFPISIEPPNSGDVTWIHSERGVDGSGE
jgi:hypothetical protein